jgi:hypothetical protein
MLRAALLLSMAMLATACDSVGSHVAPQVPTSSTSAGSSATSGARQTLLARLNAPHPDAWPGPLARGVADADIDGRIDPSITGFERQVMEKVMLLLPPRERGGNVTFVDEDGTIYVNKPALRNVSVRQVTPSPQSGRVMTQGLQLPGGFDALTGPFRRVYTSNPAATYGGGGPPLWALGSASVNIPCARPASEIGTVSNLWQDYWPFLSYGATGFAYLEAFDDNDSNYEVGLQYYPDGNNKMGDWTPYYNMRTGTGEIQISPQGDSSHLQCNSEVDLGIAVQSSHIIYGTIAGTTITNVYVSYPGQNVAINSPVVPPTPPPINVASIRFARMTTIAFDAKKIQGSGYAFI